MVTAGWLGRVADGFDLAVEAMGAKKLTGLVYEDQKR
jgi:hypothetical protein